MEAGRPRANCVCGTVAKHYGNNLGRIVLPRGFRGVGSSQQGGQGRAEQFTSWWPADTHTREPGRLWDKVHQGPPPVTASSNEVPPPEVSTTPTQTATLPGDQAPQNT